VLTERKSTFYSISEWRTGKDLEGIECDLRKVLYLNLPQGAEKNIVQCRDRVSNGHFPNRSSEDYHYSSLLGKTACCNLVGFVDSAASFSRIAALCL
jgi:hypothetical protein